MSAALVPRIQRVRHAFGLGTALSVAACTWGTYDGSYSLDAGATGDSTVGAEGGGQECTSQAPYCSGNAVQTCVGGRWMTSNCANGTSCVNGVCSVAPSCTGFGCDASADTSGASSDGGRQCNSTTCAGCCSMNSCITALPTGKSADELCGTSGAACQDCTTTGRTCKMGVCSSGVGGSDSGATDASSTDSGGADSGTFCGAPGDAGVGDPTLANPYAVAVEASGTTALVTESGPGWLTRVDTTTRYRVATVASGLQYPNLLAIESSGTSALVAARSINNSTPELVRVDLTTGCWQFVAPLPNNPGGMAIEAGDATVLIAAGQTLERITLATGGVQTITSSLIGAATGLAVVPGGTSVLVPEGNQLEQVDLTSATTSTIATTTSAGVTFGSANLEAAGTLLVVSSSCLYRLDPKAGVTRLMCGIPSSHLALESSGASFLVTDSVRLERMYIDTPISVIPGTPYDSSHTPATGFSNAARVLPETGGSTALVLESYPADVARVDLTTGAITDFTVTFPKGFSDSFSSFVIEPGGTSVLVMPVATANAPNLWRVNLVPGSSASPNAAVVSNLLSCGDDLVLESGGATALVPCSTLQRVTLSSGAVTSLSSGLRGQSIVLESSGSTAVVGGGGEVQLVPVSAAAATVLLNNLPFVSSYGIGPMALEPDGHHVLYTDLGGGSLGRLVRVDLDTRAVTAFCGECFQANTENLGGGVAIEAGGATALIADSSKGIKRVTLPPQ